MLGMMGMRGAVRGAAQAVGMESAALAADFFSPLVGAGGVSYTM